MLSHELSSPHKQTVRPRSLAVLHGASGAFLSRRLIERGIRPMTKTLSVGQDLYRQGERHGHVYVLVDGWAFRHQVLPDGRRQILDFLLPGAVLGLSDRETSTHGAETLTRCTVAVLPRHAVLEMLRADPHAALQLFEQMVESETRAFDHLTSLGRRSARERIAALMVELCHRVHALGLEKPTDTVALPLKQAHIADALGLTNEHVCRTLKTMRNEGIMSLSEGQLHVRDLVRLAQEAGMDSADDAHDHVATRPGAANARRIERTDAVPAMTCAA
ncbi:MAG: Crp/Fnr family transcriptional regulator [Alphaproteobacteria bacterium]